MLHFLESLPYKTYVGVFLCSLCASYWLVPKLSWLAHGLGLLIPGRRDARNAASLGGLALGLPFLVGISLLLLLENQVSQNMYVVPLQTRGLFLGAAAALAIGLLHDVLRLHRFLRLALQVGLAGLAYHYGFRLESFGNAGGTWSPHILALTVLWIAGLINLLEVLNRHTAALPKAMLALCLALLVVAFLQDQYRNIVVACFLCGALLGLLSHGADTRPDLGSSGTYFVGYILSVAALQSTMLQTPPDLLLIGLGTILVLLAAFIRVPTYLLRPRFARPGPAARLRMLHHYKQAFALELARTTDLERSWQLLCRAAETFGILALVHRSNDGHDLRRLGPVPSGGVSLPLPASGGYVQLSLPGDGTHATESSLFEELLSAYDGNVEAANLRAVGARSQDPRVLLVNRYYGDMSATGQIVQELSEDLVQLGAAVTVLAGSLRYEDGSYVPGRNERTEAGVHLARIAPTHFGRTSHLDRVMDFAFFYGAALAWVLRTPASRYSHILVFTDPPLIALLGALCGRLKGWRFIYGVQDLYPQMAHALGILSDGLLYRALAALNRFALQRADAVVAVSRGMAKRIAQLSAPTVVAVIPNWTDGSKISPPQDDTGDRPYRVIYAGNLGLAQQVDTVVELVQHFVGRQDVEFLFVGGGLLRTKLQHLVSVAGHANVRVLDYVDKDRLTVLLAGCDLGLVSLSPSLEGLAMPTKTYTYLAAGLPLLALGARHIDFDDLVSGYGTHFGADQLSQAVAFLEAEIRLGPGRAPRQRIRAHFLAHLDRPIRTRSYYDLLSALQVSSASPAAVRGHE